MVSTDTGQVVRPGTREYVEHLKSLLVSIFIAAPLIAIVLVVLFIQLILALPGGIPGEGLMYIILWALILFGPGIIVLWFAHKINVRHWWLMIPFGLWPILNCIAFAMVQSYTPPHLRTEPEKTASPKWLWLLGLLPLVAFAIMAAASADYRGMMFTGSPTGAMMPIGPEITCGWGIAIGVGLMAALAVYSTWLGSVRLRTRTLTLLAVVALVLILPGIWLALTGPSFIESYQHFLAD